MGAVTLAQGPAKNDGRSGQAIGYALGQHGIPPDEVNTPKPPQSNIGQSSGRSQSPRSQKSEDGQGTSTSQEKEPQSSEEVRILKVVPIFGETWPATDTYERL